jgi:hypothetical protein
VGRIGLPKNGFQHCPRCTYPMITARAYGSGSSSDHAGVAGLDPDLPYGPHDLGDWWDSRFDRGRRFERNLEWWQSVWDFFDGFFRRAKLSGLRDAMRRDPDGFICPNCLHWAGKKSQRGFTR